MEMAKWIVGFVALSATSLAFAQSPDIAGRWQGVLEGAPPLRTVITIRKSNDGSLRAKVNSIDEVPDSFPFESAIFDGKSLHLVMASPVAVEFTGTVSKDGRQIAGMWTRDGKTSALLLTHPDAQTTWVTDPAVHSVRYVAVEPKVQLEVVDWGGTGNPLILLAGLGDTAHVFDGLASKLTAKFHVYGITRRGFGDSDVPNPVETNYTADRLGEDIVAVISALHLEHPLLVGHSIAGEELTSVCTRQPDRVGGLVYLEAGYQYSLYVPSQAAFEIDANDMRRSLERLSNEPSTRETKDLMAKIARELPAFGLEMGETLQSLETEPERPGPSEQALRDQSFLAARAIRQGTQRYTKLTCPTLAIFAVPHLMGPPKDQTPEEVARSKAEDINRTEIQAKAFAALPNVKVVRIPNASHYVFQSNEAEVIKEISAFAATLPSN